MDKFEGKKFHCACGTTWADEWDEDTVIVCPACNMLVKDWTNHWIVNIEFIRSGETSEHQQATSGTIIDIPNNIETGEDGYKFLGWVNEADIDPEVLKDPVTNIFYWGMFRSLGKTILVDDRDMRMHRVFLTKDGEYTVEW